MSLHSWDKDLYLGIVDTVVEYTDGLSRCKHMVLRMIVCYHMMMIQSIQYQDKQGAISGLDYLLVGSVVTVLCLMVLRFEVGR